MLRKFTFREIDWMILTVALILAVVGVLEIYSTTVHSPLAGEYKRQIAWVVVGLATLLVVSQLDYHILLDHSTGLYILGLLGLLALLVGGHAIGGARRWVRIAGFTFQVSEIVKLIIIVWVASYFADKRTKAVSWRDLAVLGTMVGLPAALVALEPDLGTALTFLPIVAAGVFLAGVRFRQIAALALLGALMVPVGWHFLRPYQRQRLMTFVHPAKNVQGSGYQVAQSKIAIGSGGFWGKGIGKGTQSRLGFIPVSHADFIFAAFAEEQGFVGTFLVVLLYFVLLVRLLDGAQLAGDRAGIFLVVGLTAVLFFQVCVNIGMMIGLLPITGIPLPLMSQGGSSVLFTFAGLGLVMSVRMKRLVNL
ncbi:MAG TPA: rod shape-determining protein RodA [Terriglobia bacterium]|nr:rod shape-determining protein RodA [Terriglobia bacterium]